MAQEKYHISLRILHWLMAIAILGMIGVGWYMEGLDNSDFKFTLYGLHKSIGVTLLVLVAIRLLIRKKKGAPELPKTIPGKIRKLARSTQVLLYGLMFAVPIAGYMMSDAGGYGVSWFGIKLPVIFPKDKALGELAHELHYYFGYALLAIVVLHIAGAIKHRFFDKKENDVLPTMM